MRGSSPLQDEKPEEDDYLDDEMQQADGQAIERIKQVIEEYQEEMNNFELHKEGEIGIVNFWFSFIICSHSFRRSN